MRIGIDARLWHESGVGRYIRNLVSAIGALETSHQYVLFLRRQEFNSVILPSKQFTKRLADVRWHTFAEQTKLPAILRKNKLDLVHFPYFSIPLFPGVPFVVTIHDLILHTYGTGVASTLPFPKYQLKRFGYRLVMNRAVHGSKHIITVTQATKDELLSHFHVKKDKISIIYEAIDQHILQKKKQNAIIQKPYFLYVGNAYPHKNIDIMLKAFSRVLNQFPQATLVFAGKEDYFYKRVKNRIAQLGVDASMLFHNDPHDTVLANLYSHAIALVSPSFMEGFGFPCLEAMANGCPVIASDIPAYREVLGNIPLYFDPYDIHSLTKRMEEAFTKDRDGLVDKIERGLERVKRYSWEKAAKETLAVYEDSYRLRQS